MINYFLCRYWLDLTPSDIHWNLSDTGWAKSAWSSVFAPWTQGACVFVHHSPKFTPQRVLQVCFKKKFYTCNHAKFCQTVKSLYKLIFITGVGEVSHQHFLCYTDGIPHAGARELCQVQPQLHTPLCQRRGATGMTEPCFFVYQLCYISLYQLFYIYYFILIILYLVSLLYLLFSIYC